MVCNSVKVDAAELAQDQTVSYLLFSLFVTQVVQVLNGQHAQDDLHRRRLPPSRQGLGVTLGQVVANHAEQSVVIQYVVNSDQFRTHLDG